MHSIHASKDCPRSEPQGRLQFIHSGEVDLRVLECIQFYFENLGTIQKHYFAYSALCYK